MKIHRSTILRIRSKKNINKISPKRNLKNFQNSKFKLISLRPLSEIWNQEQILVEYPEK
jgi:hypothetical protein